MIPHEKLAKVLDRFDAVQAEMNADVSPDRFVALSKEFAELQPVAEAARGLEEARQAEADAKEMLNDPEMAEMAREELDALAETLPALEQEMQILLLPKDAADDLNVILEVRAGTGGDEAALFAGDLYRMYERYAQSQGWKVEPVSISAGDVGGFKEITASISGKGVFAKLKFESGVHRVQRVPTTESGGRIHTSAATVAVLPEPEEVDIEVEDKDIRIDVFRASGAGGQHVNTTDSAVRITHLPTGLVVQQQDEKSQHKNKAKALKILRARLFDAERERAAKERADDRKGQVGSGDRSERIRTYNFPQGRVTDHRINLTLHKLDKIIEGDGESNSLTRGAIYRDLLDQFRSAELASPDLDARLLMAAAVGVDDVALIADPDQLVDAQHVDVLQGYAGRRLAGEPVSRILGEREFWGLSFSLNQATLDPRPDSETLVEAVLAQVSDKTADLRILDLGTGTGCLLLALLSELPNARGLGVDCSTDAIEVARANAERLGLGDRSMFRVGNWGEGLTESFDLVISNPPYIPSADIDQLSLEVRSHDPMGALDGGADGLAAYREIAEEAARLLTPGGAAFWELGIGQSDDVAKIASHAGLKVSGIHSDLAGVPRVIGLKRAI
eukprot:s1_g243.t1